MWGYCRPNIQAKKNDFYRPLTTQNGGESNAKMQLIHPRRFYGGAVIFDETEKARGEKKKVSVSQKNGK